MNARDLKKWQRFRPVDWDESQGYAKIMQIGYAEDVDFCYMIVEQGNRRMTMDVPGALEVVLGPELLSREEEKRRKQLLEAVRGVSENRRSAGWDQGVIDQLVREGGIWEIVGREVGWPIGCDGEDGWESWEDAVGRIEEKVREQKKAKT